MTQPARRELPPRANLAQQKSQARELLQAFDRHDRDAVTRVRAVLPDKVRIVLADAQFVLSREYGFTNWPALKHHLEARAEAMRAPHEQLHDAMMCGDATTARELLSRHPEFRPMINVPLFAYNAPALVACAGDADMVEVLLDFGADPNQRSTWWAGGFHPLHSATGLAAERLLAAGAVPDACATAHLDDAPLLASILAATPSRVHERGGDGQTPLHFARSRGVVVIGEQARRDRGLVQRRRHGPRQSRRTKATEIRVDRTLGEAQCPRQLALAQPLVIPRRSTSNPCRIGSLAAGTTALRAKSPGEGGPAVVPYSHLTT